VLFYSWCLSATVDIITIITIIAVVAVVVVSVPLPRYWQRYKQACWY
jgi:hypothetical protein